ncbi:MAG: glycosyltransferase family 39 protein [Leptolyngbyaceae cyanobacterium T60_A2020_046]|nr:glycosyltransferase family 39 protein [Leptolyngbyaceae cyanobacterium T60_A2020_046]
MAEILRRCGPVLVVLVGLRLWFWVMGFPNPDEAYYWLWGQHLDLSYFDHPPLQAWGQGLVSAVLGRSPVALRLLNVLSTVGVLALYGEICRQIYGRRQLENWWLTVVLVFTSPLFFLFLAIAWHDHGLVLFGTTAGYCLSRFLHSLSRRPQGNGLWLYGAGLALGLAGLCKYLAVLLVLGFGVAIAANYRWRGLFRDLRLYLAGAIALGITAPVWLWNVQNEYASFAFYLGRSGAAGESAWQWWGPLGFVALSVLILGPAQSWAIAMALRLPAQSPFESTYRRVAIAVFLTSSVGLAVLSLRAPVLYYWNILAYPLLFPLVPPVLASLRGPLRWRNLWALQLAKRLGCVVIAALVIHFTIVPLSALVGPAGDDDTRMVYGWQQVSAVVRDRAAVANSEPLLLTTDYRSAAALAYALDDSSVMAISGRIDQFDFWYDRDRMAGRDALLLGDDWHPICPAHMAMFERTDPPETITVQRLGVFIKTYTLLRGYGFDAGPTDDYPRLPDYPLAFTSDGEHCTPP